MNIKDVNEFFQKKYQNGIIYRRGATGYCNNKTSYVVIFDKTKEFIKKYTYNCSSYAELLRELGFNTYYQDDIDNMKNLIKKYQNDINSDGSIDEFFGDIIKIDDETKKRLNNEIRKIKEKIENAIIVEKSK